MFWRDITPSSWGWSYLKEINSLIYSWQTCECFWCVQGCYWLEWRGVTMWPGSNSGLTHMLQNLEWKKNVTSVNSGFILETECATCRLLSLNLYLLVSYRVAEKPCLILSGFCVDSILLLTGLQCAWGVLRPPDTSVLWWFLCCHVAWCAVCSCMEQEPRCCTVSVGLYDIYENFKVKKFVCVAFMGPNYLNVPCLRTVKFLLSVVWLWKH
jgi:hypothetical protein